MSSAASVKHLDEECGRRIRHAQIISKVSDVVRELVDNSVDAGARSIQILLDNYGLKRIEVKDNGQGIPAEDVRRLFRGGYTSKLSDDSHLSCSEQYGFRGEALGAICSLSGLILITKTEDDSSARRFVLNKAGQVTSETVVPLGNGTVITVRDLFKDYPVRLKHNSEAKVQRNQLKDIEFYLKCVGIANPGVYFALYHNGNLIWSKPAVKSTEQALTTVLGVALAKTLSSCMSAELSSELKENEEDGAWKGKMELFVPKKPVDMRNMGFTTSKMTMVFVNRRLINADVYQQVIKRYAIGGANNPTPQEQRKFPLAVLIINVPPVEVDFNRETDKSKVFLTCHDSVMTKLESMLQSYYGISLGGLSDGDLISESVNTSATTSELNTSSGSETDRTIGPSSLATPVKATEKPDSRTAGCLTPSASTPEKRKENIMSFLDNLPCSGNFASTSNQAPRSVAPPSVIPASPPTRNSENEKSFDIAEFTLSSGNTTKDPVTKNGLPLAENLRNSLDNVYDKQIPNEDHHQEGRILPFTSNGSGNVRTEPAEGNRGLPFGNICPVSREVAAIVEENLLNTSISSVSSEIDWSLGSAPQCGAVVHTEAPSGRNKRSPQEIFHQPKRVKLLDSSFERSPSRCETPRNPQRQLTLESFKNPNAGLRPFLKLTAPMRRPSPVLNTSRDCTPERSTNPLSSTPASVRTDESFFPRTMEYIREKESRSGSSASTVTDVTECSSLVGVTVAVEVDSYKPKKDSKDTTSSDSRDELEVINHLSGTPYYVVKIDGLLGIFNPPKFLDFLRTLDLQDEQDASEDATETLLQQFAKNVESIDEETAAGIFEVIADLHENSSDA